VDAVRGTTIARRYTLAIFDIAGLASTMPLAISNTIAACSRSAAAL
jgi:hypothetical protein